MGPILRDFEAHSILTRGSRLKKNGEFERARAPARPFEAEDRRLEPC
jgi:hypothetical protein